jgi:hypothetical protein
MKNESIIDLVKRFKSKNNKLKFEEIQIVIEPDIRNYIADKVADIQVIDKTIEYTFYQAESKISFFNVKTDFVEWVKTIASHYDYVTANFFISNKDSDYKLLCKKITPELKLHISNGKLFKKTDEYTLVNYILKQLKNKAHTFYDPKYSILEWSILVGKNYYKYVDIGLDSLTESEFGQLYSEVQEKLKAQISFKHRSLNQDEKKEVMESVLTNFWERFDNYNPRYAFSTWLNYMVNNEQEKLKRRIVNHISYDEISYSISASDEPSILNDDESSVLNDAEVGGLLDRCITSEWNALGTKGYKGMVKMFAWHFKNREDGYRLIQDENLESFNIIGPHAAILRYKLWFKEDKKKVSLK